MTFTVGLDDAAAIALATVIRTLRPGDYGVDASAWYRALDEISPQLPNERIRSA